MTLSVLIAPGFAAMHENKFLFPIAACSAGGQHGDWYT